LFLPAAGAQNRPVPGADSVETALVVRHSAQRQGALRVTRAGPGLPEIAPGAQVQVAGVVGVSPVIIVTPPPPVVDRVVVRRTGPDLPRYTFTLQQPRHSALPPEPVAATLTRTISSGPITLTETRNLPARPRCPAPSLAFGLDWGPFHYRWWSDNRRYARGWSVSGGSLDYATAQSGFWGR
jgi:hypothetical protein